MKKKEKALPLDAEGRIKKIIAEVLEVDVKKIKPNSKFKEDLGMDSMMALEILAGIEKAFKIQVPEQSLPKIKSLNDVVKLTNKLLPKK